MTDPVASADFDAVFLDECAAIGKSGGEALSGLAFSGGGIRSATFNLGILQALAELKLLRQFDYLSCVSGGGYIGGWLSAFIHRRCEGRVELAEEALKTGGAENPAIRFLRSYSNYLTPKASFFSADTLTAVATYVRNLYLNLAVLLLVLGGFLLLPRLMVWGARWLSGWEGASVQSEARLWPLFAAGVVCIVIAMLFIGLNLGSRAAFSVARPFYTRQSWVLALVVAPGLLSAWLIGYGFYAGAPRLAQIPAAGWMLWGVAVYVLPWFAGWGLGRLRAGDRDGEVAIAPARLLRMALFAATAGAFGGLLLAALARFGSAIWSLGYNGSWLASGFSTALLLKFYSLVVVVHIGLMGRDFSNHSREWWARLGGWVLLVALVWAMLFAVVYLAPAFLHWAPQWFVGSGAAAWLASTAAGVVLGRSADTGGAQASRWREVAAKVTPYVFVAGLVALVAFAVHTLLLYATCGACALHAYPPQTSLWTLIDYESAYFKRVPIGVVALFASGALLLASALAWRIDVNLFSIYHFYRQRLIRCYLGASRCKTRMPHPFTGFDPRDDMPLADLCRLDNGQTVCQRPYPIHNTAMNLVAGKQLAWQQRRAAAFAFTPLACGSSFTLPDEHGACLSHYRPSDRYMAGVWLGSAMAISGAAASPNMGYHSSPALTFLLTVFNVRLGHWNGNPAHSRAWATQGPRFGGTYLLRELFGLTDHTSPYVYLSDGGHFENLGLYELVRRRCVTIIAIDAGQDALKTFDDLGNAIRKCYADFGVVIDVHADALKTGYSAVGRIHYPDAPEGTLIYVKPKLTGSEPADLQNYALTHPDFPHQSTADQWFDESQFESYRKLGHWIGRAVFEAPLMNARQRLEVGDDLSGIGALMREAAGLPP